MSEQEKENLDRITAHRFMKQCYDTTGPFIGRLFEVGRNDLFVIVGTGKEIIDQADSLQFFLGDRYLSGKYIDRNAKPKL